MKSRPPAGGFILVGVVMFVLALTILGLSLFTLSSYEAQSITLSHSRQQGMYDAESGIEMVKVLIMAPPNRSLARATAAVGSRNIVSAVAMQHRLGGSWDSTGTVTADSTVLIRVTSVNYGERRTLEARFRPKPLRDYYKRLFTVANSVLVENAELTPPVNHPAAQLKLSGGCWQYVDFPGDTTWLKTQTTWTGRTFDFTEPVSMPNVTDYVATHPTPYSPDTVLTGNIRTLDFSIHPNNTSIAYYRTLSNPTPGSPFTYEDNKETVIYVKDTVVWIAPAGIRFEYKVELHKKQDNRAVLIIVAGANNAFPTNSTSDYAIHFKGGLGVKNNQVSVILVTADRVVIEFVNSGNSYSGTVDNLSVLCRDLQLMGPNDKAPNYDLILGHQPSMDDLIERLYADPSDPLPRPSSASNALSVIRGSWRTPTP